MTRRLLPGDCLIAADVFKELSLNQDMTKAKRRLNMQLINQKRLGRKNSAVFFKASIANTSTSMPLGYPKCGVFRT